MIEEFNKYTSNYDIKNPEIKRKYDHSFRVMEKNIELAEFLNLNEEDRYVAKVVGLLHDFGRFEQYRLYQTYVDLNSIDHANYSVDILFNKGQISNYVENRKYDKIIKDAIKNHNKLQIEDNLEEYSMLHCKMIRDSDKTDILYNIGYLKEIKLNECLDEISEEVRKTFEKHTSVNNADIKHNNDKILAYIAQVFDINYVYTLISIKKNKIIEKIFERIIDKEKFGFYFESVYNYIDYVIKNEDNFEIRKEIIEKKLN